MEANWSHQPPIQEIVHAPFSYETTHTTSQCTVPVTSRQPNAFETNRRTPPRTGGHRLHGDPGDRL